VNGDVEVIDSKVFYTKPERNQRYERSLNKCKFDGRKNASNLRLLRAKGVFVLKAKSSQVDTLLNTK